MGEDGLPDYVLDPNAVLNDKYAAWRYGAPSDYSKTRAFYEETKQTTHQAGSLPSLVSNLVRNWEIEASFKTSLDYWRTIDHSKYTFSLNGGSPQTGDHMLRSRGKGHCQSAWWIGGLIDIQGIVIARVNDSLQLENIDVWFDAMDMFRQIAREETIEGETKGLVEAAGGCPVLGHGSANILLLPFSFE
ncbi:hypothetical protein CNMCM5793_004131 [Aspergillus hiratsukae]|uniref:Uncharacterized protein n=1 Tax=Aspergillus hiratsukae TaxID=1194566 RepID=A0A8H6UBY5_9EURO|nr:hypothetical protein CNMCM5793_004131 [Aspergillus hiratsukae]KAF7172853.1 hypothetical protein CNMCM6106_006948 [Aspergillus hiratsukae]